MRHLLNGELNKMENEEALKKIEEIRTHRGYDNLTKWEQDFLDSEEKL